MGCIIVLFIAVFGSSFLFVAGHELAPALFRCGKLSSTAVYPLALARVI